MISFSTDDVDPRDRFDQWREMRSRALFGMTIELEAERRPAFRAAYRARPVGGAVVCEMTGSAYRVSRTEADIARQPANSLCISLQIVGPGRLAAGRNDIQLVHNGDITTAHSDLPRSAIPSTENDFSNLVLKIPIDDELTLARPTHDMFATGLMEGTGFSRPFRALFRAVTGNSERLAHPETDVAHIARLVIMARGRLAPTMPEVRAAFRAGLRYAALEIMARDKRKHALSPAMVAKELGISVRQLHIIFESAELSFSRSLSLMRVEHALVLLAEAPTLSITQVAYASGFESLATFYRAFSGRCGMTPGDARQLASLGGTC